MVGERERDKESGKRTRAQETRIYIYIYIVLVFPAVVQPLSSASDPCFVLFFSFFFILPAPFCNETRARPYYVRILFLGNFKCVVYMRARDHAAIVF